MAAVVAGATLALALTCGAPGARAEENEAGEARVALSAEQLIAAIRTAVAAKPGGVLEFEAESEGGKVLCEVKILAADGKAYEVEVDVAANRALSVELDDEDDDAQDKD